MKRLVVTPNGWPCSLLDCPPGYFISVHGTLCLKSEYTENGKPIAYNDAGEYYWDKEGETVHPVIYAWEEYDPF